MNKKQAEEFTTDVLIADALLRIKTLERLLISKGVFSQEEYDDVMGDISSKIAKTILQRASVPGDLDKLITSLQNSSKKEPQN